MSALDFKLFARDKLILIGVLNRLTQGELAVLTWLAVLEGHTLKDRTQLWDKFGHPKDEDINWRRGQKFGPMLPFTRQGCLKACEALVARGWAEWCYAGYGVSGGYRSGMRLLPLVILAAAPFWLNDYLAFGARLPDSQTETPVDVAGENTETAVAQARAEVTPVSKSTAAKKTTTVARGSSRNRRLRSTPASTAAYVKRDHWWVQVEGSQKPKVHRASDCKSWAAVWKFPDDLGVHVPEVGRGRTAREAVVNLIESSSIMHGGRKLFAEVKDLKISFRSRGGDGLRQKRFPADETWFVERKTRKAVAS